MMIIEIIIQYSGYYYIYLIIIIIIIIIIITVITCIYVYVLDEKKVSGLLTLYSPSSFGVCVCLSVCYIP